MEKQGEIILYQPDEAVRLEVRLEDETVWLTQAQIAELFQRDRTVITKHINNVFKEKELEEKSNVHFLHIANSDKPVKFFSLDVIISVGYRVKSVRGTQFRQWANKILKEYLLKGYSINQRLNDMEYRMNNRFFQIEKTIAEHDAKIDFFVRTSLPPVEGIFFDGQIFDAYKFATDLIKSAKCSLVLIDNYVDESVLLMLSKRNSGISATIYTHKINAQLQLDLNKHNDQYPPIEARTYKSSHDRFLIIDNTEVYHIGASLKDLGKKMFAFSKLDLPAHTIINVL
ncbi:virulence RhuM family protein [Bacteroides salyersiae]|nr:RhuM family protein [Bacteroides salyersiae]